MEDVPARLCTQVTYDTISRGCPYSSTQTPESEHDMDANKRFDRERAARIKPSPRTLQQRWDLGTLTTIVLTHFIGPKKEPPTH
jgi:hypothetical protein